MTNLKASFSIFLFVSSAAHARTCASETGGQTNSKIACHLAVLVPSPENVSVLRLYPPQPDQLGLPIIHSVAPKEHRTASGSASEPHILNRSKRDFTLLLDPGARRTPPAARITTRKVIKRKVGLVCAGALA